MSETTKPAQTPTAPAAGSVCFTHFNDRSDPPWLAIHRESALKLLSGYSLTDREKTDVFWLMAGYCRLLEEAGLIHSGQTEAEAVSKACGLTPDSSSAPAGLELARCPFCRCNAPHHAQKSGFPVEVWCPSCGARGPERLTAREADEAWNEREEHEVDRLRSALVAARKHILERNGLCRDADTKAAIEITRVLSPNAEMRD